MTYFQCSVILQSKKYRLLVFIVTLLFGCYVMKLLLQLQEGVYSTATPPSNAAYIAMKSASNATPADTSYVSPLMAPPVVSPTPNIPAGSAVTIDKKRYVCPTFGPRLGNLMFLYASNYGVAFDNNMTLALSVHDPIFTPFLIPKPVTKNRFSKCAFTAKTLRQKEPRIYEKFNIPSKGNIRLTGYLETWKYFANSFEDLRAQYTFRPKFALEADNIIENIVKITYPNIDIRHVTTVGIHVRRGDKLKEGLPLATKEYIQKAKQYFLDRFKNVVFIVASTQDNESIAWCNDNIINGLGTSLQTNSQSKFVDMAILSKCNHIIITVGTYSWWSGFLNKGTVFYFDHYDPRVRVDFIPPGWIGITANNTLVSRDIHP